MEDLQQGKVTGRMGLFEGSRIGVADHEGQGRWPLRNIA